MKEMVTLPEEYLDFIAFMKAQALLRPELNKRLNACLAKLSSERKKNQTVSEPVLSHSPHRMIEFLSLFSRDDRFKWYTHKWDMAAQFNIDDRIERQKIDKSVLTNMVYPKESGPVVNEKTYNQVWNFINFSNTGTKPFSWKNTSFENIDYGWHSIVDLSRDNPKIQVENLNLANGRQFKDYVRMFKAVIEFRTDLREDDRFSELVYENITSGLPKDFAVTFSDDFNVIGYDFNIYCDVLGLLDALNTVCQWMTRHKSRSSAVDIDLKSEDEYYLLEIFHKESYFDNIEKLKKPSGDFDNLRRRLFSVCDFSMEGDFRKDGKKQNPIVVKALEGNTRMRNKILTDCTIAELDREVGGVKYKFKIYKR